MPTGTRPGAKRRPDFPTSITLALSPTTRTLPVGPVGTGFDQGFFAGFTLGVGFDTGCWWYKNGTAYIYLPFGGADRRELREGVDYAARARNEAQGYTWVLELVVRK